MNLSKYRYKTNDSFLDYEFYSIGPNGRIKKVVRYSPQNAGGITYFNLGFGDWNEKKNRIDDLAITNNKDRQKILATVAATVLEFTLHFPDVPVYAKGSTPARTRLYQMGIVANWKEIEPLVRVYGYVEGGWESFRKNVNYQAFIAFRK
jgi:hypothetical protein